MKKKFNLILTIQFSIAAYAVTIILLCFIGLMPKWLMYFTAYPLAGLSFLYSLIYLIFSRFIERLDEYLNSQYFRFANSAKYQEKLFNIFIDHNLILDKYHILTAEFYNSYFLINFSKTKKLILFYRKYYKKLHKHIDMGVIAEDMTDGSCCSICGCYFKNPEDESLFTHGYPVVCWDCWNKKSSYQRAEVETF